MANNPDTRKLSHQAPTQRASAGVIRMLPGMNNYNKPVKNHPERQY